LGNNLREKIVGEIESIFAVRIDSEWNARIKASQNAAGNYVITELHVTPSDASLPQEGLTSSVLRKIRLSDLINSALSDDDYVELELLLGSSNESADDVRKIWHKQIVGDWKRQGSKAHDISLYAKTAFFFVAELRENTLSPLQSLAPKLGIDRATLARRINKARELKLLTSPARSGQSAGKSGGSLTPKALSILGITREEEK